MDGVVARVFMTVMTLMMASVLVFGITEIIPGDPAAYMMGLNADPAALNALRAEFGFDEPILVRYGHWIGGMVHGDFGTSYTYRVPVAGLIAERLWVSVPLTLYTLALVLLLAVPLALVAVRFHRLWPDRLISAGAGLGLAVPNFWLGVLLVGVFAVNLSWFSAGGFPGWQAGLAPGLRALTLPAIALAVPQAAILTRIMRTALLETASADYVRTARAKGLSAGEILVRHQFKNALIPVLTIIGLQFSFLIAGGVIIEKIFFLPGLGQLVLEAVAQRDLITVRAIVMILIVLVLMVSLLVDLGYRLIDPRIRSGRP
ncbi:MAG: ABC transporter permease [Pseudomonadota bacterium]